MGTPWAIAGMSAAATTLALDTGEGRQLINRVGHEFFDDILGMRPSTAHTFSSVTLHIAGTMLVNAGLNAIIHPANGPPGVTTDEQKAILQEVQATQTAQSGNEINIDDGIGRLSKTKWAQTNRGKQIVKALKVAHSEGKISTAPLRGNTRAYYNPNTGEIVISTKTALMEVPGRLAHEGSHLVQDMSGQIYGLPSEREAYNYGYAVDTEMGADAFNPSDDWIKRAYRFK